MNRKSFIKSLLGLSPLAIFPFVKAEKEWPKGVYCGLCREPTEYGTKCSTCGARFWIFTDFHPSDFPTHSPAEGLGGVDNE